MISGDIVGMKFEYGPKVLALYSYRAKGFMFGSAHLV